ncbi:4'-phosphopantetheinyl transferase family protein [Zooshikella harenae]|uniref:4'-phosphopantetheinyl transferase superfamily protein n=1 Tax=Zooshikella harenae TaxID=2827238 RepID=A0ABS5ZCN5_9GAMM|nr:4'-phosphopantetheinyl transferase superfamily protein [Zooshikella harenae]MBU2711030.1 4'-phosphopantetheinyl transferase superfamily protein [Zooshikella harenae]
MSNNAASHLLLNFIPPRLKGRDAYLIELDRHVLPSHDELIHYLTPSEKKHVSSIKYAQSYDRVVVSRAVLRILLGYYLSCSPSSVDITVGGHGKPILKEESLFFNVSHSKNKYMYLLAREVSVGVDIEYINSRKHWQEIARDYFHPDEYSFLSNGLDRSDLIRQFYRIWVGKEAVMKFSGLGMALPINSFCIFPYKELQEVHYEFNSEQSCCSLQLINRQDLFTCATASPANKKIDIKHIIINE